MNQDLLSIVPLPNRPLGAYADSWENSLRARNRAKATIDSYLLCVRLLGDFLERNQLPTEVSAIERPHVEAFIAHSLMTRSANTAGIRYRSLVQFFKWLESEDEIKVSPMAQMAPPAVPEVPVPVVSDGVLKRLLEACEGRRFEDRRDTAITRLFIDTPSRISEIANLLVSDLDKENNQVRVLGKGSKERMAFFGPKTAEALDRYLRVRATHRCATSGRLWLGREGPMSRSGLDQMLKSRCRIAGLEPLHWHQTRHTFAHQWKANGGSDDDLMRLAGWSSRSMLAKYGASLADERAKDAYFKTLPGERI